MSTSTTAADPAELLTRWLSHRQAVGELPGDDVAEPPAAAKDPQTPVAAGAPSSVEAGRAVLEAFADQLRGPAGPDPSDGLGSAAGADVVPSPAPAAHSPDVPPGAASDPDQDPPSSRRAPVTPAPGSVTFPPRRGARRALTVLTLIASAATGAAGAVAWGDRTQTTLAVAGVLLLLTWLLSGLRARARGTEVSIVDGVLRVRRGDSTHRFTLTGAHPPIDVVGTPGERGWKVLIQRKGMAPYVITRRMVDPRLFTDAIRLHRPDA